ncbi:hypothetical protein GQ457_04G018760 [Hibiscus cannabinus]
MASRHRRALDFRREFGFERIWEDSFVEVKLTKQVNTVYVRHQKHELTTPRNRYPCDNGNKKVTAFPPRDIVYKQDKQLHDLGIS